MELLRCGVGWLFGTKNTIPFPASPVSLPSPTCADCGVVVCDSPTASSWMLTFLGEESSSYESNTDQLVTQIWLVNVYALSYLLQMAFLEPFWPNPEKQQRVLGRKLLMSRPLKPGTHRVNHGNLQRNWNFRVFGRKKKKVWPFKHNLY